jgi:Domain of unknown function (DUF4252)
MTKKAILISFFLLLVSIKPILAQEQPLKDIAEDRKEHKFCFYPSTLRMINLTHNPDFDELVNGIDKLLIYDLDSTARANNSYRDIISAYQKLNYEEYASAYGGGIDFFIYGKEKGHETEYIGIVKHNDMLTAFYLRGHLAVSNLPELIQSMRNGNFINPFDFNIKDFGKYTQGQ